MGDYILGGVIAGLLAWLIKIVSDLANAVEMFLQPQIVFYFGNARLLKMQLKDTQSLPLTIVAEDKFGNPVPGAFDAAPAWALSDPSFGSVVAAADGQSASVVPANGKLGDLQVQVSASIGGKAVAGSFPLTIIPGDATQVAIQPGTPVDQ